MVERRVAADHLQTTRAGIGLKHVGGGFSQKRAVEIFEAISEGATDAKGVKWNGDEIDIDGRTTVHYMVPCVLDPLKVAVMDQKCLRANEEVVRLQGEVTARHATVAGNAGRKVDGGRPQVLCGGGTDDCVGIVPEAARILGADIKQSEPFDNFRRGGIKRDLLSMPNPLEYALDRTPRTLSAFRMEILRIGESAAIAENTPGGSVFVRFTI